MGIGLMLGLFLSPAWGADLRCKTLELPVEGQTQVARAANVSPRRFELSYIFEFCDQVDKIYFITRDVETGASESRLVPNTGLIEKIYRPRNVPAEAFAQVPNRIEVLDDNGYEMKTEPGALRGAELRFYRGDRFYSLSATRAERRQFAPLEPRLLSVKLPENVGVELAESTLSDHGFVIWSLRTVGDFEMTYLIDAAKGTTIRLVEAYLGNEKGDLRLDAPDLGPNMFSFPQIERTVQLNNLAVEERLPPMTSAAWRDKEEGRLTVIENVKLRVWSQRHPDQKSDHEKYLPRKSDHQVVSEWIEFFSAADLREMILDRPAALEEATVASRYLLENQFPRLVPLARKSENTRESIKMFSEAAGALMLSGALTGAQLREAIVDHLEAVPAAARDERICEELLTGLAGGDVGSEVTRDIRKASLNLEILRKSLEKDRESVDLENLRATLEKFGRRPR